MPNVMIEGEVKTVAEILSLTKLREARRKAHLKTEDVANAIGKTKTSIWRYENAATPLSVPVLQELLKLYDISVMDVFIHRSER